MSSGNRKVTLLEILVRPFPKRKSFGSGVLELCGWRRPLLKVLFLYKTVALLRHASDVGPVYVLFVIFIVSCIYSWLC